MKNLITVIGCKLKVTYFMVFKSQFHKVRIWFLIGCWRRLLVCDWLFDVAAGL